MRMKHLFTVLLICILGYGCSTGQKKRSAVESSQPALVELPDFSSVNTDNVFAYECGDSLQFSAHVTKDSTWLFLPDTTLKVLPVKSGSGARFQAHSYLYWSKGDEALLQLPQGSLMSCKSIPQEKSWAAARIRGVDFRAIGQEPGWLLEITKRKQIKYIGNYGEDTLVTQYPKPRTDRPQRTIYNTETGGHSLQVEITNEPCTDGMSGFGFPATVTVTLDGETYKGCGRTLN